MALATSIRFDFVDDKSKTSFTKVRVPSNIGLSDVIEFAQDMAQLLVDMTQGVLTGASITIDVDLSGVAGLKAAAGAISDVFTKGFVQFGSSVSGFFKRMAIPTFDETLVPVGGDAVDTANVDVAAFVASMESGLTVTSGTLAPVDKDGNDLTGVDYFRKTFRKHRGG